jgi:hypothetical protein
MSDVARIAAELQRQYGDDAEVIATLRAAEVAALGDETALAHWDAVIAYLRLAAPPENLTELH